MVSKPLTGGFETLCNGGFAAGSERVVLFEAFGSEEGVNWVLDACRQATNRTPTDVVVSHHHGDHVGGLAALAQLSEPPQLFTTESIRATLPAELESWTKDANILKPDREHYDRAWWLISRTASPGVAILRATWSPSSTVVLPTAVI